MKTPDSDVHGVTSGVTRRRFIAGSAIAGLLPICGASAQDAYVIGATAAMTGPASATQAPVMEMLRIYVDRWRASGQGVQFSETRAYVDKVERLKKIYRRAYAHELGYG